MSCSGKKADTPPNIVFILADDLGYADLSSYGSSFINTPYLDQMAEEGVKLTSYYAAQPVCSASRAAILTGSYPNRIGIHNAWGPKWKSGINYDELTLAEMLKNNGYKTGIFGKWHLGSVEKYFPTRQGFDEFYGILYSNDMWRFHPEYPDSYPEDLLLYQNETPIQELIDQSDLTKDITSESIDFIERNKNNPFFLYIAHPQPHVPLFVSKDFENITGNGLYADVITEIDYSVGRVLRSLEENGLTENTIVVFWADHGTGYPRGKIHTYDDGLKIPLIIRFPEKFQHLAPALPGTVIDELVLHMDLYATTLHWAGLPIPDHVQSRNLCGSQRDDERAFVCSARDRLDNNPEMIRTIRTKKYRYIRNLLPHQPYASFYPDGGFFAPVPQESSSDCAFWETSCLPSKEKVHDPELHEESNCDHGLHI